jgi:hypothetical protein
VELDPHDPVGAGPVLKEVAPADGASDFLSDSDLDKLVQAINVVRVIARTSPLEDVRIDRGWQQENHRARLNIRGGSAPAGALK